MIVSFINWQAKTEAADSTGVGGSAEDESYDAIKSNRTSSTCHDDVYNKLRAVEVEINAVKSSLELTNLARNEEDFLERDDGKEHENVEGKGDDYGASPNDTSLQHALATDRLRSLIKRKAQLEKEISDTSKDIKAEKLLKRIVEEEPSSKRRSKEVQKKNKHQSKRLKTVSYSEDDDFDSVLNAASAGFVETVSHFQFIVC